MKRKINEVGTGTFTVSIPMKWVKKYNLKKGDEIDVQEQDSKLILSKALKNEKKSVEIALSEVPSQDYQKFIRSTIGRFYRYGFSNIQVNFQNPETFSMIKSSVDEFIGADIVDVKNLNCTIKVFPTEGDEDSDIHLLKIFVTIKYMFTIIEEDILKSNFSRESTIRELRDNNWKLRDYVLRNAYLQNLTYEKFSALYVILNAYEKISGNLLIFYRDYLNRQKIVDKRNVEAVMKTVKELLVWFHSIIGKEEQITYAVEAKLRNKLNLCNRHILNVLMHQKSDHAFLALVYFTLELLDGTVSYLSVYKKSIN